MKYFHLLTTLLLFTCSCKQETKKATVLNFDLFKLTAPGDWSTIKRQGIDSYFGGLTNGDDTLWFDLGKYDVNQELEIDTNKIAKDTVNGLVAEISIPKNTDTGSFSLYISHVNKNDRFTMYGDHIKDKNSVLKIFKSILFEESDTSKNPALTENKFLLDVRLPGQKLFKSYCTNCHKRELNFTGPAMVNALENRNNDWLYLFLTNRKQVKTDSIQEAFKKEYQPIHCIEFPGFSRNEVDAIYNYCFTKK